MTQPLGDERLVCWGALVLVFPGRGHRGELGLPSLL